MSCGVCISGYDYDGMSELHSRSEVQKSRKAHRCDECRQTIDVGQPYVYERWKYDGEFVTSHVCTICDEIFTKFTGECEGAPPPVGEFWQGMREYGFESFNTACMDGLSAAAKSRMIEAWQKWKGLQ